MYQEVLCALRHAFEFFGGVPGTILSDNCSPLVLRNKLKAEVGGARVT